jgi:hypothetical protein
VQGPSGFQSACNLSAVKPSVEARILELRANGDGILKIGRKLGVGTSVVQRVFKQEPQPS